MRLYGLQKRASKLHGAACGICQNRPTARQGRARARREGKADALGRDHVDGWSERNFNEHWDTHSWIYGEDWLWPTYPGGVDWLEALEREEREAAKDYAWTLAYAMSRAI